ncbi:Type I restriction-modification system, specificity subunit S [Methanosarcina siciliae C2J]|uniref:Type I restriction-modification system, specificity subunit S n=1 Tax=Methanosarcina siciliae C2J TaxID=1434118 RepID=A0A0E3PMF0_9EURY|nr:restriction endonuclease subunit S [Methanosarcina siciliae]AKB35634.1 Type I restriction-modification system, specificity subunit S [Methanosarcina siciliae C2J]
MSVECRVENIPPGYKQTEVGVIPEDWNTKTCSALSDLITVGIVIRPTQYYAKQGVPALRSANIREKGIDDIDMVFISEKANALLSKSQVRTGDVLTVRTGYPGTSAVVPPSFSGSNCIDILITRPSKAISPTFLSAWINSSFGKSQVLRNQGGLAQQHFNVSDLKSLVVALPPTKAEQEAIAEALSDTDALIESLEQLIAKKRQIKQGAMQELLTGKKRLPEFEIKKGHKQTEVGVVPEDWMVTKLGDICQIFGRIGFRGYTVNDIVKSGDGAITISPSNIQDNKTDFSHCTYISWIKYEESPEIKIQNGDILLVKTGSTVGKTAIVRNLPMKATINPQIVVLKNTKIDNIFLGYLTGFKVIQNQIVATVVGGALPTLSQSQIAQFKFPLPSTKAEQEAIASILSDMDSEISALEKKLAKARQIKQGMMQELLTGKIRLI